MIVYFGFADPRPGGHLYSPSGPTAEECFVKSGQTSGPASASADVGGDDDVAGNDDDGNDNCDDDGDV